MTTISKHEMQRMEAILQEAEDAAWILADDAMKEATKSNYWADFWYLTGKIAKGIEDHFGHYCPLSFGYRGEIAQTALRKVGYPEIV